MYDQKKHVQKEWQVIACGALTIATIGVSLSIPVKPGEIPIARLLAFATSGAFFVAGAVIEKSKEPLDRQKAVISVKQNKLFVNSQAIETAILLEEQRCAGDKIVAKTVGGS